MIGGDLQTLQEIALPPPISYMPQTGGWLVILVFFLTTIFFCGLHARKRYRANQYRREAMVALIAIEDKLHDINLRAQALRELPTLVKRTALSFAVRNEIAALTTTDWLTFLDRTATRNNTKNYFSNDVGQLLWQLAYRENTELAKISEGEIHALCQLLRNWIVNHVAV